MDANVSTMTMPKTMPVQNLLRYISLQTQEFLVLKKRESDFFHFFRKNTLNIISELNDDFSKDFFNVLHISVGQKIKILENCPDFLTFPGTTFNLF